MVVRFGAGAYFGLGVIDPYGTTGKNADIDFLLHAQDGTDGLSYKRTKLEPKDLSSYDEQFDQVQPGEETVEGSVSDKCTFNATQDLLRMMNGANPTVSGAGPYVYSFTGAKKPSKFSDPDHYQAGTTTRNWVVEMYKGSIVRSATETNSNTGNLVITASGGASVITRSTGSWSSTAYVRGSLVTIAGSVGIANDGANGVYVVESATYTPNGALTLRKAVGGYGSWYTSDSIATGTLTAATISAVYQESLFYQGCNVKSLKLSFQRNDYVQREMEMVGTTYSIGASSHSYRQAHTVGGTGLHSLGAGVTTTTITRDTGSWISDGYVIGGTVTIHKSLTAANIGVTATISGVTTLVLTISTAAFTVSALDTSLRVSGSGITNASEVYGGTPGSQPKVWVSDYVTSNPGMGATKFLTLGGTPFICRSADLTIEEPLEDRYDIGQSSSELRLPEKKRSVKLEVELETSDEKFLNIINRPDTKSFGASGGDYTGANTLQIQGAGSTVGRSLVFTFPYLTIDGDAETRVEGIGPTTAKFTLMAMSDDVNNPAYTVVVTNGDAGYRT